MNFASPILAALLLATAASADVRGVADTEIVFGVHTDLSGPTAAWGTGFVNSTRLRFEQANAGDGVHGRTLRYVVEDAQYQIPRAVQAVNKLVNRDKVFAVLHGMGTPMNNAVQGGLLAKGIPNLFPTTFAKVVGEPFHRLRFVLPSTYYSQIRAAVRYFAEKEGKKKVCTMTQDTDYGQENLDAVKEQLAAMSLPLVASTAHRPTDTDFNAALLKLKRADCDLVVLGTIVRDTILIVGGAKKMGWDVPFVGSVPVFENVVAEAEGGATEGLYAMTVVEPLDPETSSPEAKKFREAYVAKFGVEPNVPALIGYTTSDLVVLALEKAGRELTVDSFVTALESIRGYEDIFGGPTQSFGPDRHQGSTESFLAQVQGGRWVRVTEPLGY